MNQKLHVLSHYVTPPIVADMALIVLCGGSMFEKVDEWMDDNPWIFLVAAGIFAYHALDSFRDFLRLKVVKEATDIAKDAADA